MLDLDGVVWLGEDPIDGSAAAIRALRGAGTRVTFFTNNSFARREDHLAKFARHGVEVDDEELLTSAQAASFLLKPGERAFVLGGAGIGEALRLRGVEVVEEADAGSADAVVVGLDRELRFERLTTAVRAVLSGARLVATNDDATYPSREGPEPGGGAILAAVRYATRATAEVAGKPYEPAAALVAERLGPIAVMVGDRPETDGAFAQRLGARFGLVRSGVTAIGTESVDPVPTFDAPDLASLVAGVI